jgi:hypothetical protein
MSTPDEFDSWAAWLVDEDRLKRHLAPFVVVDALLGPQPAADTPPALLEAYHRHVHMGAERGWM